MHPTHCDGLRRIARLAAVLVTLGSPDLVQPATDPAMGPSAPGADGSMLCFVQMPSPAIADGGTSEDIDQDLDAFRAAARAAGLEYRERLTFHTLWNGLSIAFDPADRGLLDRLPGVAAIIPVTAVVLRPSRFAATSADVVVAALERAQADGLAAADLDPGSLGGSPPGPTAAALDRFVGLAGAAIRPPFKARGPSESPETCAAIAYEYALALDAARSCKTTKHEEQCSIAVWDNLLCPCNTFVNPANRTAMATMTAAWNDWGAGACGSSIECGAALCPTIMGGTCAPTASTGPPGPRRGQCLDRW